MNFIMYLILLYVNMHIINEYNILEINRSISFLSYFCDALIHKYIDVLTVTTEPYTPPLTANILSRVGNLISSNAPFSGSFSSVKLQYPIH